jgi:hypothetical protein
MGEVIAFDEPDAVFARCCPFEFYGAFYHVVDEVFGFLVLGCAVVEDDCFYVLVEGD